MAVLTGEEKARILKAREWVSERLKNPALRVGLGDVYNFMSYTDITFVCQPPRVFEYGDWLVGKIRGAWGQALDRRCEFEKHSPYIFRPAARDVLWEGHKILGEAPGKPPYVIFVDREDALVKIHLRLFGWANFWRDEAALAMEEALVRGINLNEDTHFRASWKVLDKYWQFHAFVPKRPARKDVFIYWDMPLRLGGRDHMVDSHTKLVESLVERIVSVGRWCGLDVQIDQPDLIGKIKHIHGKTLPPKYVTSHIRRSSRAPGKEFVMTGVLATSLLENVGKSIWPILDIGEICFAGSNTSFGFGKYRI